jgi:hypothetical protein
MKKLLIACVALTGFMFAKAQTADEIVAKYTEAIGGKAAWEKITSLRYEGSLTVQGTEVSTVTTVLQGKGYKIDISVAGMSGYQIMTTAAGWSFMPWQGQTEKQPSTADEVKEGQGDLEASGNGLVFYKERGHTVELVGKEDVDGTECHKIRLTEKSGKVSNFFIDPKTWFLVKEVSKEKANGQETEVSTGYSNYKKQSGDVLIPMTVVLPFGEMTINKVDINTPVDEKIFKPE